MNKITHQTTEEKKNERENKKKKKNAFFKPHSSFLLASLKSVVFPTAPGSNSKLTLSEV